ncbi:MAG TPA: ROK family protein [Firmicutes bacterium]|nr:ROK family protein [Bacillota bacterium]
MRLAVGVDLGGTNLRAGLVTEAGEVAAHVGRSTPARESGAALLAALVEAINVVRQEAHGEPVGVGVAVTGLLDLAAGRVRESANVPGLDGLVLGPELSARLGLPVWLENDVRAATLGEAWHGAGRGAGTLVAVFAGTGVGSGIMLQGKLWRGVSGSAGEVGPLILAERGLTSPWGQRGSLEALSSGPGLATAYALLRQGRPLKGRVDNSLSAREVAAAAARGEGLAQRVIARGGRYLGRAVAAYVNIINPERMILGGGVLSLGEIFWQGVERGYREGVLGGPAAACRLVPAALGGESGVVGAAAMVFRYVDGVQFWL